MADEQLLSQRNSTQNGRIVAAVTNAAGNELNNGDVNATNSINLKNGSTKIVCDFDMNSNHLNESASKAPPDGGTRAWCVVISAFLCNSIMFGIINTYGSTIGQKINEDLKENNIPEASSKAGKSISNYFFLLHNSSR